MKTSTQATQLLYHISSQCTFANNKHLGLPS
ncbi:hypothetical protein F383_38764 [Gossypium arboreum]|uniref:Uncharacterized protein n=1 Tax=Gossypium arboreum TaxID=29729 RepID=A0A0B0MI71_GOSAR|nr:hypothetical protein F383_38764 [Gossypium arboreum]